MPPQFQQGLLYEHQWQRNMRLKEHQVLEHVSPEGRELAGAEGRLMNPGYSTLYTLALNSDN